MCKTQIGDPQLSHLIATAQACQGQGRIDTGGKNKAHLSRQIIEQQFNEIVNLFRVDGVIIIEDKDAVIANIGNIPDQVGHN